MNKQQYIWAKIVFILMVLIFLVSGFIFGYFYNYKSNNSCTNNPFIYGVSEMNKLNNVNFVCSCSDNGKRPFYFNSTEINKGAIVIGEINLHDRKKEIDNSYLNNTNFIE